MREAGAWAPIRRPACALTRNRPRVSYLSRHSFGIRAERAVVERCGFRRPERQRKAVSNRKQTAVGFQRRMRARDGNPDSRHAATGRPSRRLARAWAGLNRQPGPFPETNLFSGARHKAGCACALNGGEFAAEGEQRMSVATSFAFFWQTRRSRRSSLTMLLPLLLIPVLYLVMIRPQQKRQKQWQAMLGVHQDRRPGHDRRRHPRHHPVHQGRCRS